MSLAAARRPLPVPDPEPGPVTAWVADHLDGLFVEAAGDVEPSPRFRGGQRAADEAMARFDVSGYARSRNEAYPVARRGSSGLSPYIRHGLLPLPDVWDAVDGGPAADVRRFRDELLWQEYARHWYARLGPATAAPLRHRVEATPVPGPTPGVSQTEPPPATSTRTWLAWS